MKYNERIREDSSLTQQKVAVLLHKEEHMQIMRAAKQKSLLTIY